MKGIMRAVDRFCARHPRFGIPNLMMFIVVGNVIVYLFSMMDTTATLYNLLAFDPAMILRGQVWRIVTFLLIPQSGSLLMLAISLYFYYFIGSTLEREWGSGKFTIYYFTGALFLIVFSLVVYLIWGFRIGITAYHLNLGMFFVFATFYPDMRVLLFFFIPIKVKWIAFVDLAYFVIDIIRYPFPVNLVPVVVLLHYLVFCGGWLFDLVRPARMRQRANTINYKRAAKKVRQQQANAPYQRKCAVCGRTDRDHPELEFRYCSRCAGYHCFCEDHINNHVHFTE